MKKIILFSLLPVLTLAIVLAVARAAEPWRKIPLPSSKALTLPVPGYLGPTNSFPATLVVSPDGRFGALLNQGYGTEESGGRQSIAILDLGTNQLRDFPDDRLGEDAHQSYFIGLEFSSDGKHLYASMGSITDPTGEKPGDTGNGIAVYKFDAGQVLPERFVKIPPRRVAADKAVATGLRKTAPGMDIPYPAGFAVLAGTKGDRLLVANNLSDNVVLLDVNSGEILKSFDLGRARYVPSVYPYTVVANRAGTRAWVSLWNESTVAELAVETGKVTRRMEIGRPADAVAPGSHPTAMLLNSKEDTLYVAMSNLDAVAGVDLVGDKPVHFYRAIETEPPSRGTVPIAIALSLDGKRLYAANASLDSVAVYEIGNVRDLRETLPLGFIPTEWYPSALAVAGKDLLIATGKGRGSGPNGRKATLEREGRHREHPYIPTLVGGSIARIGLADIDRNLAAYTGQVEEDNLLRSDPGKFAFVGGKNPIRHVIYVLKENRTYDQVFGDLPVGDGDPSLTMYGRDITPNEHKLALEFGVLDNFYDSGEVSGDGHLWSNAAITSDYNEKNWPIRYRSHERTYDADGSVADELPLDEGIPDIDDPGTGFLWDNFRKHGLSYRIYGEFIHAVWCKDEKPESAREGTPSSGSAACPAAEIRKGDPLPKNVGSPPGGPSPWPWAIPVLKQMRPTKAGLREHYDPLFPDFETSYPDQLRADEFLREFREFVKGRGTAGGLPQFILLYLPNDHTSGTRPGRATPQAAVADNDLALGRVVEAVSHSPYWDDTAIFVIEDDAQDGADHVDAHRSTALVISRYAPLPPKEQKAFVDHHFYTTVSMVHTMEELLGLPAMNLFDAHAPLMRPLFSGPGTQLPYDADDQNLRSGLIYQMNARDGVGANESSKLDFSRPDAADNRKLNRILWRDAKGDAPMPASQHARGRLR